ncbi:MAG: hypothetical protein H0V22_07155 [Solirubrobacterales bacterium]|nr:hypothetical protein [Solirubrobacterales bacterium]
MVAPNLSVMFGGRLGGTPHVPHHPTGAPLVAALLAVAVSTLALAASPRARDPAPVSTDS